MILSFHHEPNLFYIFTNMTYIPYFFEEVAIHMDLEQLMRWSKITFQ